jgi:hypothetical protein
MARIDERLHDSRASNAVAIHLAARQRLGVRVITLPAVLAALATLAQIFDSVSGKGSLWSVFVSIGITAWWVTIAMYLSGRHGRKPSRRLCGQRALQDEDVCVERCGIEQSGSPGYRL